VFADLRDPRPWNGDGRGLIPVSQLKVGGTWVLAITGGTGEFENVGGSATVEIVDDTGNSEHTLHLLP